MSIGSQAAVLVVNSETNNKNKNCENEKCDTKRTCDALTKFFNINSKHTEEAPFNSFENEKK